MCARRERWVGDALCSSRRSQSQEIIVGRRKQGSWRTIERVPVCVHAS